MEGAISEAASTSQVGFLLAATLLQPGREPQGEASASNESSMGWSSLPLTFPGLTTAELNSGRAQPAAAGHNPGPHLLAAPAATAAADGVGSKRPSKSEAATPLPHLKRAWVQTAERDFSTHADGSHTGNRTPSSARNIASGRLPNGLGRLPNGLGSTDRKRTGKDRQAWLQSKTARDCFVVITSEGLGDSQGLSCCHDSYAARWSWRPLAAAAGGHAMRTCNTRQHGDVQTIEPQCVW